MLLCVFACMMTKHKVQKKSLIFPDTTPNFASENINITHFRGAKKGLYIKIYSTVKRSKIIIFSCKIQGSFWKYEAPFSELSVDNLIQKRRKTPCGCHETFLNPFVMLKLTSLHHYSSGAASKIFKNI